jgi:hypothetical protein
MWLVKAYSCSCIYAGKRLLGRLLRVLFPPESLADAHGAVVADICSGDIELLYRFECAAYPAADKIIAIHA